MRSKIHTNTEAKSESGRSRGEPMLAAMNRCDEAPATAGLMFAADELCPQPAYATTRRARDELLVVDGPFVETKELIVGNSVCGATEGSM